MPNFIKTQPEKFWRYLGSNRKQLEQIQQNNVLITKTKAISNAMNEYFHSVFSPQTENSLQFHEQTDIEPDFISYEGVLALLLDIKEKSSEGPDQIPNAFLRRYAEPISHILTAIFRLCLRLAILPDDWLLARVVAIFKKRK